VIEVLKAKTAGFSILALLKKSALLTAGIAQSRLVLEIS
jgi:hypothetical protein